MTLAVAACMRNEGPFLLEWVAYHRAIGFDQVHVITNDCTDGTDAMLDRLQSLGLARHHRNRIGPGEAPQVAGMRLLLDQPGVREADWLLHIDADEFLNVTAGDGGARDLSQIGGDADAMAILWRPFGHSGQERWQGGSVLRAFTRTQARPMKRNAGHKTFFRPARFRSAIDHMPKEPVSADPLAVNTRGERVTGRALLQPGRARYRLGWAHVTWDNACINHYAIRSTDVFLMKNDRGDGMAADRDKYFLNSVFYRRHNRNEVEDRSILRHWKATAAIMAEMRADRELKALNREALAAFIRRRDAVLTPERVAEWSLPEPAAT